MYYLPKKKKKKKKKIDIIQGKYSRVIANLLYSHANWLEVAHLTKR